MVEAQVTAHLTAACPSPESRTYKNQFSLQLSSVTVKDTSVYYFAGATVRGLQCGHRHKPLFGSSQDQQGVLENLKGLS
jgi:hypothetical protein